MMVLATAVSWAWLVAQVGPITSQEIVAGSGPAAQAGDVVTVQIVAQTTDGRVLADTRRRGLAFTFLLGGGEVEPWMEAAVRGVRSGGVRRFLLSPEEAYGEDGLPPIVPPRTRLVVSLTVVSIRPKQPDR
ncbi:MAG: FKBP-type peptidyl-prolyl cis-trans isomerase [Fimbriimonadales bacterium]|nr:FKBP-type peptidyl-prolyl cis-trans isomerase [Fimbriimonadales bacterium]